MGVRIVWVVRVELEGMETLGVAFAQLPSLPGRQFTHDLPAFTQAQPLHKPVLLHLQHTIVNFAPHHVLLNARQVDVIATGRMQSISNIFVQLDFWQPAGMSLNDDSNERQPGRTAGVWAPIVQGIAVVFYSNILHRQLERSNKG